VSAHKGQGANSHRRDRKRNRYATNLADRLKVLDRRRDPEGIIRRKKVERLLSRSKGKVGAA